MLSESFSIINPLFLMNFISHLVTIPPGPLLSDALMSSPIMANEDGSMPSSVGGFGGNVDYVDADVDPELAMVSAEYICCHSIARWIDIKCVKNCFVGSSCFSRRITTKTGRRK